MNRAPPTLRRELPPAWLGSSLVLAVCPGSSRLDVPGVTGWEEPGLIFVGVDWAEAVPP
jgi:hypothetical protein